MPNESENGPQMETMGRIRQCPHGFFPPLGGHTLFTSSCYKITDYFPIENAMGVGFLPDRNLKVILFMAHPSVEAEGRSLLLLDSVIAHQE